MQKEGQIRIPSGCAIAAIISKEGNKINGEKIIAGLAQMHDRSNGLGGGFAGYGIYPDLKDYYAFHVFFDNDHVMYDCETFLREHFTIVKAEDIPTRKIPEIADIPLIRRYFCAPLEHELSRLQLDENEYVARLVIKINSEIKGAYVFSSGKNMGVFKAVGFPEDVGRFYCLDKYEAYCWTGHGRYPTNTPGWWGGAHPFALLDFSTVHNGEISSYDANRRFIEMFGYKCTLQTDTEAMTYIADYLVRRQKLTLTEFSSVVAAPFWNTIVKKPPEVANQLTYLRKMYPSLLVTGPFSIVLAFSGGLLALNDRLKLRSLVVADKDDWIYIASEEAAILKMEPNATNVYAPAGGEPIIVKVKEGAY